MPFALGQGVDDAAFDCEIAAQREFGRARVVGEDRVGDVGDGLAEPVRDAQRHGRQVERLQHIDGAAVTVEGLVRVADIDGWQREGQQDGHRHRICVLRLVEVDQLDVGRELGMAELPLLEIMVVADGQRILGIGDLLPKAFGPSEDFVPALGSGRERQMLRADLEVGRMAEGVDRIDRPLAPERRLELIHHRDAEEFSDVAAGDLGAIEAVLLLPHFHAAVGEHVGGGAVDVLRKGLRGRLPGGPVIREVDRLALVAAGEEQERGRFGAAGPGAHLERRVWLVYPVLEDRILFVAGDHRAGSTRVPIGGSGLRSRFRTGGPGPCRCG